MSQEPPNPLRTRPKFVLVAVVLLLVGVVIVAISMTVPATAPRAGVAALAAHPEPRWMPSGEIAIVGDEKFTKHVQAALVLLETRAPEAHAIIRANIGRIRQNERSGMDVFANPPTYDLSDTSAYSSLEWCAGTIAHDSIHSKQYFDLVEKVGSANVPNDAWTGTESEKKCNAHQFMCSSKSAHRSASSNTWRRWMARIRTWMGTAITMMMTTG